MTCAPASGRAPSARTSSIGSVESRWSCRPCGRVPTTSFPSRSTSCRPGGPSRRTPEWRSSRIAGPATSASSGTWSSWPRCCPNRPSSAHMRCGSKTPPGARCRKSAKRPERSCRKAPSSCGDARWASWKRSPSAPRSPAMAAIAARSPRSLASRAAACCGSSIRSGFGPEPGLLRAEVGVAAHRLLVEVGELDALFRLHLALADLAVQRLLDALGQVARLVLYPRQHALHGVARDHFLDVEVLRVVVVDEDVHLVHAPEEVVHVAHDVLVGAGQEHAQVVRLAGPERMERDGLVHRLAFDEGVDLPVRVAGDVHDGGVARGLLRVPVERSDGEEVVDRPVIGRALEEREVGHVLVGKAVVEPAGGARHPLALLVELDQPPAEAPEQSLDGGALL